MELNEFGLLKDLKLQQGWKVYQNLLETKFDTNYKKLRNINLSLAELAKLNGFLDGIEYALKAIEFKLEEEAK